MLGREQRRLATHPLVEQVTRVSIENAGAGFDIISFSTPSAIVHDHFIEVKSFSGRRRFFWTRNEMETARRLGEAYHLCIVDRDRIYPSDYSPEIGRAHVSTPVTNANLVCHLHLENKQHTIRIKQHN